MHNHCLIKDYRRRTRHLIFERTNFLLLLTKIRKIFETAKYFVKYFVLLFRFYFRYDCFVKQRYERFLKLQNLFQIFLFLFASVSVIYTAKIRIVF